MIDCRLVRDIPYVIWDDLTLFLDLYLPHEADEPVPVVLWVPGGGWRNCAKENARSLILVDHGFAAASIQYRVSGRAPAPANVYDCKAGIRWLRTYADDYGMDPDRIGLWGSSAGGHLVSLLALTHDASEFETGDLSTEVQAVCDFCGPTDLTLMADAEMAAAYPRLREAVDEYLGGPVDENLDLARRISPMSHVRADAPPMLIAHGENDPVVPPTESTRFQEALEETGAEDVMLYVVPDAGHGWDQSLTNDLVMEFFCRTLL